MSYKIRLRQNKPRSDEDMYREFRRKQNLEEHELKFLMWYENGRGENFEYSDKRWARELKSVLNRLVRSGHTIKDLHEYVPDQCSQASLKNSTRLLVLKEETCETIVKTFKNLQL